MVEECGGAGTNRQVALLAAVIWQARKTNNLAEVYQQAEKFENWLDR